MKEILDNFIEVKLANAKDEVPKSKGIYLWLNHQNEIVYVGIALGKNGLRHRICNQHLNPEYLEFREAKHNSKDVFQLGHPIVKIRSNNQAKKGIDKSSFRKSIGRKLEIPPGHDTCNFILKNLRLKVLANEDASYVKELEKNLISTHQPIFNSTYK